MNYRTYKFFEEKSYDADTTIVEDIRIKDVISSIVIELAALNAAATMTAHPVAILKKIEIVDGSDSLYSLDGYELEALDWYHQGGKFRSNWNMALNGSYIERFIGINFGRTLWDRDWALDPTKFRNLQIRISLDIDAGANASTATKIGMWANMFDERGVSPKGFLTAKEIKSYAIVSAVHEYTDLPVDRPYRALYLRPFAAGTEPNQLVSKIKLSEDQDKKVPYDLDLAAITRNLVARYGICEELYYFAIASTNRYLYCAPSTRVIALAAPWGETAVANSLTLYDGDGGRLKTIGSAAETNAQVLVKGYIPHACYEIPFGDKDDPGDAYEVSALGSLRADITGAGSATGYLFLEQYRVY